MITDYLKQHWRVLTARTVVVAVVVAMAAGGLATMAASLLLSVAGWLPANLCGIGLLGGALLVLFSAVVTLQIARESERDAVKQISNAPGVPESESAAQEG